MMNNPGGKECVLVMKEIIQTANTVDLAIEEGCRALGVDRDDAQFEILQMPTPKTFGLFGGSPAKVRIYIEDDTPVKIAVDYLTEVLRQMGAEDFSISVEESENSAVLLLNGENLGFVIGHRGETLDSLQYLTSLVANRGERSYYRIQINSGNYREKRTQALEALALKLAESSKKSGRLNHMEAMNPYERRIVHTAIQNVEGISSWSVGQDKDRHVVIGPADMEGQGEGFKPYQKNSGRGHSGRSSGGPRNGSNRGPRRNSDNGRPAQTQTAQNREPKRDAGDYSLYGRIDKQ